MITNEGVGQLSETNLVLNLITAHVTEQFKASDDVGSALILVHGHLNIVLEQLVNSRSQLLLNVLWENILERILHHLADVLTCCVRSVQFSSVESISQVLHLLMDVTVFALRVSAGPRLRLVWVLRVNFVSVLHRSTFSVIAKVDYLSIEQLASALLVS